ncbi:MAG: LysR family transcriptional regulator [Methylobacterium mesophilicum]|nr:LysR family transcriptional regulator [Methylobacterium mesophilicum]
MRLKHKQVLLNQLDLNLLRVFDAMMAERNVNRAAVRIGRTQSAVSHSIGRLRTIVGDELFVRVQGCMEPTAIAKELASVIGPALAAIFATLNNQLNFDPSRTTRAFRMGISDYTAIGFMALFTTYFVEAAPFAKLNVLHTQADRARDLLQSRDLDCAILGNFNADHPELRSQLLAEDDNLCAMWSKSRHAGAGLTLESYIAAPHLQVSIDGISEGVADQVLAALGHRRKIVATIPHYLMAPWVIRGTDMLAILGSRLLLALDPASELILRRPPLSLPKVTISLIYNRQSEADPGHVWLRRIIKRVSDELDADMRPRIIAMS